MDFDFNSPKKIPQLFLHRLTRQGFGIYYYTSINIHSQKDLDIIKNAQTISPGSVYWALILSS